MNKIRDLTDIVREIPDGSDIGLGGFIITRCPMAFAAEMIRQGKKDLVLYSLMGTLEADLLVGAGCAKSYSYCGGSMGRFGKLGRVNEAIENGGPTLVKEYTGLSMALQFEAGMMGIPFIPTKSLIGTDMLETLLAKNDPTVKMGKDPWSGEDYLYLRLAVPTIPSFTPRRWMRRGTSSYTDPLGIWRRRRRPRSSSSQRKSWYQTSMSRRIPRK